MRIGVGEARSDPDVRQRHGQAQFVGADGTVIGVTLFDAAEGALTPTAVVAVTVKVYAVPFVNPETIIGLAAPLALCPPGLAVTV